MKKLIFLLLAFTNQLVSAAAQNVAPNVLFILDGSGSMWQKLEGDFKITAAKTVMKDLVAKLPADARAGLVAYGHNNKSDCNDIQTLVPPGQLDKAAFTAKLEGINPQGKTPIAKSINHALALIRSETEPVTIVLVTDGLETCEGNACDIVRQAKAQGVKITMHVVGFGLEETDVSTMECIAQAGGGQYFPANSTGELAEAMNHTVVPTVEGGGYLSMKVTLDGQLEDATVRVFKKDETKETAFGRTYTGKETNPRIFPLPPGEYRAEVTSVRMDGKPMQKLTELKISGKDTLFREVDFAQGAFEILVTRNGELSDATIGIYAPGSKQTTASGRSYRVATHNPAKYSVLPGIYDVEIGSVEIAGKPAVRFENQVLQGGGVISLSHDFKSGELKIGARQGQTLVDATVSVSQNGKNVASGRTYTSADHNPKTFTLEPGKYKVEVKPLKPKGLTTKTFEVEIKANSMVERSAAW